MIIEKSSFLIFLEGGGVKMRDKMAISSHIFEKSRKGPLLRLQMRAKEDFNSHQFFPTNKQYVRI